MPRHPYTIADKNNKQAIATSPNEYPLLTAEFVVTSAAVGSVLEKEEEEELEIVVDSSKAETSVHPCALQT